MSEKFVSSKTIFVFAGFTFVFSTSAFGVMMVSYLEFQKISPIVELEQAVGFSAISNLALTFDTAVGAAGLLMVLSLLYAISERSGYRKQLFFAFSFAVTCCAVLEVIAGSLMFDFSMKHKQMYCEDEGCNPVDTPFENWQLELIHTELALFNECCNANIDAFDAAQTAELPGLGYADIQLKATRVQLGDTQECQTEPNGVLNASLTCDPVAAPGIISTISGLEGIVNRLCTCLPTIGPGASTTTARIQQLGTCAKLEAIEIPINPDAVDIPSTFISLAFVLNQYPWYADNKQQVKSLPLVATPGIPLASTGNKGFGCGLGFGKGFMWYSDLFYENTLLITSYTALGFGCSMTVFALSAVAYVYLSLSDGLDLKDYDDYAYTSPPPPSSSKLALKSELKEKPYVPSTESIVQGHVPKKRSRRRKRRLPRALKINSQGDREEPSDDEKEEPVKPLTKEELEAKIVRFYKKFEPSKLVNGRVDESVLSFVWENGVDIFNQRLREKYGVDLDNDIGDIV